MFESGQKAAILQQSLEIAVFKVSKVSLEASTVKILVNRTGIYGLGSAVDMFLQIFVADILLQILQNFRESSFKERI